MNAFLSMLNAFSFHSFVTFFYLLLEVKKIFQQFNEVVIAQ